MLGQFVLSPLFYWLCMGAVLTLTYMHSPFGMDTIDASAEIRGTSRAYEAMRVFVVSLSVASVPLCIVNNLIALILAKR